jgi:hypothetical protein
MRKLSYWAKVHPWCARLIIIFLIYPSLNITGWFFGDLLAQQNIHISYYLGYLLSLICLFLYFIYPFHGDRFRHRSIFKYKRIIDVLLIATTACFIFMTGNNVLNGTVSQSVTTAAASTNELNTAKPGHRVKMKKQDRNVIKRLVRSMRDRYRHTSPLGKALLIMVAILIFTMAFYALSAITCNIACSGSEGLAYVIFFLGLGGLIFLLVRFIQRVTKGPRSKMPEKKDT